MSSLQNFIKLLFFYLFAADVYKRQAVASVIGQIRRKLTPDMPKAGYIRTVLGSGYKFEVPQGMAE